MSSTVKSSLKATSRIDTSMNASTKPLESDRSSAGSENTSKLGHKSSRMSDWQRQHRSDDPWSFGQSGKERNKAMLEHLGDLMDRIGTRDMTQTASDDNIPGHVMPQVSHSLHAPAMFTPSSSPSSPSSPDT